MTFQSHAMAFIGNPGPETLAALQRDVVASPGFDTYLSLDGIVPLLRQGDDAGAVDALRALMPGAFLSPLVHSLLAGAFGRLGDSDQAEFEATLERAALAAIFNSGEGTAERPWRVLMISDEYDALRALGRSSVDQRQLVVGRRLLDYHRTDDGYEAYFDVMPLPDQSDELAPVPSEAAEPTS